MTEVLPADGSRDVQVASVITVTFYRPVIVLSTSLDADKPPTPLIIEPMVEGRGEWINTAIDIFRPMAYFAPGRGCAISFVHG